MPHEKKTANSERAPAGIHQLQQWQIMLETRPTEADRSTMLLLEAEVAPSRDRHSTCKSPTPAHSRAMILTIALRGSRRSYKPIRRFQVSRATLLVTTSPAMPLR